MRQGPSLAFDWAVQHETDAKGELIKYAFDGSIRSNPQATLAKFDSLQVPAELRHDLAVSMANLLKDDEPLLAVNVLSKENIADKRIGAVAGKLSAPVSQCGFTVGPGSNLTGMFESLALPPLLPICEGRMKPDFRGCISCGAQTMQASEKPG